MEFEQTWRLEPKWLEPKWLRSVVVVVVAVQTLRINCARALDGKEPFIVEGSENWRSTRDDLEEREKRRISRRKKPSPPPYGEDLVDELRQQDVHNRDIDHPFKKYCN